MKSRLWPLLLVTACSAREGDKTVPAAAVSAAVAPAASTASAAPVVSAAPELPKQCTGAQLSIDSVFKAALCRAASGAIARPVDAGVTVTLQPTPPKVKALGEVPIAVRFENKTDRPQDLWFSPQLEDPLLDPDPLVVSASLAEKPALPAAPGEPLPAPLVHVVLAPHGIATATATWQAVAAPPAPKDPQAAPAGSTVVGKLRGKPLTAAELDGMMMGVIRTAVPLAPGKYHLSVATALVGGADLGADITVTK